jgi:hypothetical protein
MSLKLKALKRKARRTRFTDVYLRHGLDVSVKTHNEAVRIERWLIHSPNESHHTSGSSLSGHTIVRTSTLAMQ